MRDRKNQFSIFNSKLKATARRFSLRVYVSALFVSVCVCVCLPQHASLCVCAFDSGQKDKQDAANQQLGLTYTHTHHKRDGKRECACC